MSQYVLEWSKKQNTFHIQPIEQAFARNQECFIADKSHDYIVLMIGTHDVVTQMMEHHRDRLKCRRSEEQINAIVDGLLADGSHEQTR